MILDNQEMDRILKTAEEKGRQVLPMGEVATYIPELGKADGTKLGICIRTKEGQIFQIGDTDTRFTIQSISKIVSLALAIFKLISRLSFSCAGTFPAAIRWAKPSAMAVLPTPGSPTSAGLFLFFRLRIPITVSISRSLPITGSIDAAFSTRSSLN